MKDKRWIDGGIAGMLLAGSVFLYLRAREFPMGSDRFPKFILAVIAVLAVILLVGALRGRSRKQAGSTGSVRDILRPYALFLGIVGYVVSMLLVGFFPATAGWGFILMPVLEAERKIVYLSILAGTILFIYVLFAYFLKVPLPQGMLFD